MRRNSSQSDSSVLVADTNEMLHIRAKGKKKKKGGGGEGGSGETPKILVL